MMDLKDKIRQAMTIKSQILDLEHELRMKRGGLQDVADQRFLHEVIEQYPQAVTINWRLLEAIVEGYPHRNMKKER